MKGEREEIAYMIGLEQEIERLKEQLNDEIQEELKQSEIMIKKQQEIERLNNIINKLFEYLKENSKQPELFESDRYYEDILDKLQELLGSDKEC